MSRGSPVEPPHSNPFPGLRPFRSEEDYLFFGRERQTAELATRLRENRFLAVVGTSGSGKSSLVRAGLIPTLLAGRMRKAGSSWEVAVMRPGGHPVALLADALCQADLYNSDEEGSVANVRVTLERSRRGLVEAVRQSDLEPSTNLLVVVDQFEEIFRFRRFGVQEEEQAFDFVNLLLEATAQEESPIYVVITMRSDFIGDCSQFAGLAEAVNRGEYLIPRLSREQCRTAIEGPVKVAGGEVTPQLAHRLLNDLGSNQDRLPVLQHALMRTWDHWLADHAEGEPLDLRHYVATGGMGEALSRHADEVFLELPDNRHRVVAERLFKAVTEYGADNRGVRRPTRVRQLCEITGASGTELRTVIDAYRRAGRTFLMPSEAVELRPETVIDVSHESLMRVWRRLQDWVEQESQSARIYRRLAETAHLHEEGKAGLFRDPDLQIADSWRESDQPNAAWAERYHDRFERAMRFLEASKEAKHAQEEAREAARRRELEQARRLAEAERLRAEEQQQSARRLRWMVGATTVVAAIAIIAMLVALAARREASRQANRAAQMLADSWHEEGRSWLERAQLLLEQKDFFGAKMLAARALGYDGLGRARLDSALAKKFPILLRPESEETRIARELLALHTPGRPIWISPQTTHHAKGIRDLALTQDRSTLISAGEDEFIRFWDLASGELLREIKKPPGISLCLSLGADGSELYEAVSGGVLRLWRLDSNAEETIGAPARSEAYCAAFTADNSYLAWGGLRNQGIQLWDAKTGEKLWAGGLQVYASGVAFRPDRKVLAVGGVEGVRLWNLETREEIPSPLVTSSRMDTQVAFSPDGSMLAGAPRDGDTVFLWDTANWELRATLLPAGYGISSLAFSQDGALLAVGGEDGLQLWDVERGAVVAEMPEPQGSVRDMVFGPGGELASASTGGTIHVYDSDSRQFRRPTRDHGRFRIEHIGFSPNGVKFFSASVEPSRLQTTRGGLLVQKDIRSGETDWVLPLRAASRAVAFSPDGTRAALSEAARVGRILKVYRLGADRLDLIGQARWEGGEHLLAVSPGGGMLAEARGQEVHFWDLSSGHATESRSFTPHSASIAQAIFTPDGQGFITAGRDEQESSWSIHFWRRQVGDPSWHTVPQKLAEIELPRSVRQLVVSPDGRFLAVTLDESEVYLSDLAEDRRVDLRGATTTVSCVAFSRDSSLLATGGPGGDLRVWDPTNGKLKVRLRNNQEVSSLCFGPDGSVLAAGTGDGRTWFYDLSALETRSRTHQVASSENLDQRVAVLAISRDNRLAGGMVDGTAVFWPLRAEAEEVRQVLVGGQPLNALAYNPEGTLLAAGTDRGQVSLVDTGSLAVTRLPSPHSHHVTDLAFSPGGSSLASASEPSRGSTAEVALFDVATGRLRHKVDIPRTGVAGLGFSPDGKKLCSATDGVLSFWDITSGTFELERETQFQAIDAMAVTPGGIVVVVHGAGIHLMEMAGGREIRQLSTDTPKGETVSRIAVSPDGSVLTLLRSGQTLEFWNLNTGKLQRRIEAHEGKVEGLAFSPDGSIVATSDNLGLIKWWSVPSVLTDSEDLASYLPYAAPEGRDLAWRLSSVQTNLYHVGQGMPFQISVPGGFLSIWQSDRPNAEKCASLFARYLHYGNYDAAASLAPDLPSTPAVQSELRALRHASLTRSFGSLRWQMRGLETSGSTDHLLALTRAEALYEAFQLAEREPLFWKSAPLPAAERAMQAEPNLPGPHRLVPRGAHWKYLDDGSDQRDGWRAREFDDATWKEGAADLGYDRSGQNTVTTEVSQGAGAERFPTTYFRHRFQVEQVDPQLALQLELRCDDGAIVYLNGEEVLRHNMPAGEVTFATLASSTVGGTQETTYSAFELDPTRFRSGPSVLAAEVHQASARSSDLHFDLELSQTVTPRVYLATLSTSDIQASLDELRGMLPRAVDDGFWDRLAFTHAASVANAKPTMLEDPRAWSARSRIQAFLGRWPEALEAVETSLRLLEDGRSVASAEEVAKQRALREEIRKRIDRERRNEADS